MASLFRHTLLVRISKVFLLLLVIAVMGGVVWVGSGSNQDISRRLVFTNIPKSEILQSIMKKPYYQGVDVHNRPYTVSADSGLQKDKENVVLEKISAEMTGDNGAWIALNAGSGILNTISKKMELEDSVEVFYEGGYQFRTQKAHVDIASGTANSSVPVEGQGPSGTIKANSFSIAERGNVIFFRGKVKVVMYR